VNEHAQNLLESLLEEIDTITFGKHPDALGGICDGHGYGAFGFISTLIAGDHDALMMAKVYNFDDEGELTAPDEVHFPLSALKEAVAKWGHLLEGNSLEGRRKKDS
jgi:hypothetical protein